MTQTMKWTGFLATLALLIVLPLYVVLEPSRQRAAQAEILEEAIQMSTDIYAENCAICHGAAGEGIGQFPALDSEGISCP